MNSDGMIEIYSKGEVGIFADTNIRLQSEGDIELLAKNNIIMQANGSKAALVGGGFNVSTKLSVDTINAKTVTAGSISEGSASVISPPSLANLPKPTTPEKIEPTDRAKTYNGPYEDCPIEEVEHKLLG